jgi:hypothetical protein
MLRSILMLLALGFCLVADAQVYQSTDEQGNPVFSDTPVPGGEEVEVPEPNVGDAVEVPPPPPPPEPVERPEIVPDREPSEVDGELVGEKRKKKGGGRYPGRPTPRGGGGHGR